VGIVQSYQQFERMTTAILRPFYHSTYFSRLYFKSVLAEKDWARDRYAFSWSFSQYLPRLLEENHYI
jgi:hypothetical protein